MTWQPTECSIKREGKKRRELFPKYLNFSETRFLSADSCDVENKLTLTTPVFAFLIPRKEIGSFKINKDYRSAFKL